MKHESTFSGLLGNNREDDKGFTLVELIVVLVILAILAAILVPALLGYIDKAKEKKDLFKARSCLDAAQAELVELYGKNAGNTKKNVPLITGYTKYTSAKNGDVDATTTDFAKEILATADMSAPNNPYVFMIAVGSNCSAKVNIDSITEHQKYTVYYAFYMETKDSTPFYYYDGEWTKSNPRNNGTNKNTEYMNEFNVIQRGAYKDLRLQYYLISNKTKWGSVDGSTFWNELKKMK